MGKSEERGKQLLSAVEQIVAADETIIARVKAIRAERPKESHESEESWLLLVAREIVRDHANKAAVAGGATSLPAIFPGIGSLVAALGGTLADMGLTLKFEVEMALALAYHFGFDIRDTKERKLAFLLASVSTHDAKTGKNFFRDLAEAERTAIWNYTPRQISKFLLTIFSKLVLYSSGKGLAKLIPFVGIAVSASVNKVLTSRVGERCVMELSSRWRMAQNEANDDIVDAEVVEDEPKDAAEDQEQAKDEKAPEKDKPEGEDGEMGS